MSYSSYVIILSLFQVMNEISANHTEKKNPSIASLKNGEVSLDDIIRNYKKPIPTFNYERPPKWETLPDFSKFKPPTPPKIAMIEPDFTEINRKLQTRPTTRVRRRRPISIVAKLGLLAILGLLTCCFKYCCKAKKESTPENQSQNIQLTAVQTSPA